MSSDELRAEVERLLARTLRSALAERDERIVRLEEALQKAEHELESVDPAPGSAFDEVLQAIAAALHT